jgi:hypothetical protein
MDEIGKSVSRAGNGKGFLSSSPHRFDSLDIQAESLTECVSRWFEVGVTMSFGSSIAKMQGTAYQTRAPERPTCTPQLHTALWNLGISEMIR